MEALLALIVSALVVGAYVCRLDLMHWRTHRVMAIAVYYAGFAIAVLIASWAAFGHAPGLSGWLSLLASGALLAYRSDEWGDRSTPKWTRRL